MRHTTSRTGWHIGFWGAVAAIVACGGIGGCSEGPEATEGVAVVQQALDPNVKAPLQLSFQLETHRSPQ